MHNYNALVDALGEDEPQNAARTRAEESAVRLTEPDPDQDELALQWTPELTLMLAILEDAVACFCMTLKRPRQNPEILSRQAEFWFRLEDWESPFSFNNICEALRLDPIATRERIFAKQPIRRPNA
jgi:hypothetical protein